MYNFLVAILIIDGLILTAVVLMQSGQGGGLASMGGGAGTDSNLIGGRQAVTLLTKTTWVTGGVFLGLALLLSVVSSRRDAANGSVLKGTFQQPATTPATTPAPATLPGTQNAPATTPAGNAAPGSTTPATTTPATTTTGQ